MRDEANATTLFNMQHLAMSSNLFRKDDRIPQENSRCRRTEVTFNYKQQYDGGYFSTAKRVWTEGL